MVGLLVCLVTPPTHPQASPTTILSPQLPCALAVTRKPYYIVTPLQCSSGAPLLQVYCQPSDPSPIALLMLLRLRQQTTRTVSASHPINYCTVYTTCTNISLARGGYQRGVHTGTVIKVTQTRPGSLRYKSNTLK